MSTGEPGTVLFVAHFYPPHVGGIENVVRQEATRLAAGGRDVQVVTSACGAPAGRRREDGVDVRRVTAWNGLERSRGVPFPVFAPTIAWHLLRASRSARVVHIHDVLYVCAWVAAAACWLRRRPYVVTQHVSLVEHPSALVQGVQRAVYAVLGGRVLRGATRVHVLNDRVRAFVVSLGVPAERVVLLPNGVDTELFRPALDQHERAALRREVGLPTGRPVVLFVGRFVPKKGYDLVMAATDPAYVVAAVGGEPEIGDRPAGNGRSGPGAGSHAGRRPGAGGSSGEVVVLGSVDQATLARVYRACDLFVLPSHGEGFPLSVQEAMASGLPVVLGDDPAYACYGLDRELVRWVPRDAAAVHAALRDLTANGGLREQMGRYSRRVATTAFSWDAHVRALIEAYRLSRDDLIEEGRV